MKRFTLGMSTYDDFDGVYFSCQANRLLHPVIDSAGEILVIDNNPKSASGKATKLFCRNTKFIRYMPFQSRTGTAVRSVVFEQALGEIVICVDCHVLLWPGSIEAIVDYLAQPQLNAPRLVQGPIVWEDLKLECPQWHDGWMNFMHGIWSDNQSIDCGSSAVPLEISNMGLGAFAARKDEWLGFNPLFRGFGGEEGYIHKKYNLHGGSAVSLPAFKWLHRFQRPCGVTYPLRSQDRIFNYFVGAFELKEPVDRIIEHFAARYSEWEVKLIYEEAKEAFFDTRGR